MENYWPWLALVLGFLLGWFFAWLFGRSGHEALTAQVESLEANVTARNTELDEARRENIALAERQLRETTALKSELERATAGASSLHADLQASRTTSAGVEAQLQSALAGQASASGDLDVVRARSAALQAELEGERSAGTAARAEFEAALAQSAALQAQLEGERSAGTTARAELEAAHAQSAALQAQLEEERSSGTAARAELDAAHAQSAALQAQLEEERTTRTSMQTELEAAHAQSARLEADLAGARSTPAATTVAAEAVVLSATRKRVRTAGSGKRTAASAASAEVEAAHGGDSDADAAAPGAVDVSSGTRSLGVELGGPAAPPDDLTRIAGIGPVFAARLNGAGIHTYSELAATSPDRLGEIVALKKWQKAETGAWVEQATRLADQPRRFSIGDDLTRIEGIGPVYATRLRAEGITTYGDLAAATTEQLAGIIDAPAWRKVAFAEWIEQAALAAAGDEAGLRTLQERLNRHEGDNLTLIEGLGTKGVAVLKGAGIENFADLAASTPESLAAAFSAAGLREAPYAAWIEEAGKRAAGKRIVHKVTRTRTVPVGATAQRACPQDLEQINGVGGVFEQRLYAHGIGTFWEVGMLNDAELSAILELKTFNSVHFQAIRDDAMRLARATDSMGQTWDGSEPDDFAGFVGIGPVLERRLYAAGICTYRQLAEAKEEILKKVADLPAFQHADVGAWIRQAQERLQQR